MGEHFLRHENWVMGVHRGEKMSECQLSQISWRQRVTEFAGCVSEVWRQVFSRQTDFRFLAVTPLTLFKRFSTPNARQSNTTTKTNIYLAFLQNFVACSEDTFAVSCYRTVTARPIPAIPSPGWRIYLTAAFKAFKNHSWISTALSLPATVHVVPCVFVCRAVSRQ